MGCLAHAALAQAALALTLAAVAPAAPAPAAPAPAASGATPPGPAVTPASEPRFGDEIAVRLFTVIVRVVDGAGEPVLGLTPGDFRVHVGRLEVPVAAVDWVGSPSPAPALAAPLDAAGTPPQGASPSAGAGAEVSGVIGPAGKLVVIFVQADNNSSPRVRGHLRTLPFTRELLAALQPEDSVAVVSFDSHLKLWQDFTRDHARVPATIYQAIHFGGSPPELAGHARHVDDADGDAGPSLALTFDEDAARRAATAERGLEVTAQALAGFPGEKVMVFLGWGLGEFSLGARTRAFDAAAQALADARVTVFALDVTEADFHHLELGLQNVAAATGGTYDKTFRFPGLAIRQLARTISGYYVLSLEAAAIPAAGGSVEVAMRDPRGRRWTVLTRPISIPTEVGER